MTTTPLYRGKRARPIRPTTRPGVAPPDPGPLPWYLRKPAPPVGMAGKVRTPEAPLDYATEYQRRKLRHERAEAERARRRADAHQQELARRKANREYRFGPADASVSSIPVKIKPPYGVPCPVCHAARGAHCIGRKRAHRERRLADRFGRPDLSPAQLRELGERLASTLPGEAV